MRLFPCYRLLIPTITMTLLIALSSTPSICAFVLRSCSSRRPVEGTCLRSLNKEKVPHVRNSDKDDDQRQKTLNVPDSDCHRFSLVKSLVRGVASIILMAQIMTASANAGTALETTASPSPLSQQQQSTVYGQPYWTIMEDGEDDGRIAANTALIDYAVGTINTMFYDHSGGAFFQPRDFYATWKHWLKQPGNQESLASRDGVVNGMQWLTAQLNDPFSRYLTREQLREELARSNFGFLGSGALVEVPSGPTFFGSLRTPVMSEVPPTLIPKRGGGVVGGDRNQLLSAKVVQNLPVLTAISPDSPAERAGLTVGDRIVAVQQDSFLGLSSRQAVKDKLAGRYQADNYAGTTELTVAKPLYAVAPVVDVDDVREVIVGYRSQRLRLTTASIAPPIPSLQAAAISSSSSSSTPDAVSGTKVAVSGGDSLVHYQLLAAQPGQQSSSLFLAHDEAQQRETVAYIRLTRFSKSSTTSFLKIIDRLENDNSDHGRSTPSSYIIDLRNNYGGVIQEAMLTASTLLRDPHAVLCYTMNSRGGFTPHDVLEFVSYDRYPGYLLSREDKMATMRQLHRDLGPTSGGLVQPQQAILASPPSSFASIREQKVKRGIHSVSTISSSSSAGAATSGLTMSQYHHHRAAQKKIVILVNEGTASAAEVFASALHDNGRTVALVGTRTYGKGLIQHTFPLPDGGGLRLTVAEYLTPALKHVTNVGGAQYNQATGDWVGGGINPDLYCESKQGIPSNIGADLCVGVALDALQEEASSSAL